MQPTTIEAVRFLACYPFSDPRVQLLESPYAFFPVPPSFPYRGTDYVRHQGEVYVSFGVYAAAPGTASTSYNSLWGNFITVQHEALGHRFDTVYAHLERIVGDLPFVPEDFRARHGRPVRAGELIGIAGSTGQSTGIIKLHFKLFSVGTDENDPRWHRHIEIDPYGISYLRRYPQPGESLEGLPHFFESDRPPFPP